MRSKPKETARSFVSVAAKRLPSIAVALTGVLLLGVILAPAEPEEPGLTLALMLGWKSGSQIPCQSAERGRFHSYASESDWGEFYLTLAGAFLYPPATSLGREESQGGDAPPPAHCSPVPAPSRIEEF